MRTAVLASILLAAGAGEAFAQGRYGYQRDRGSSAPVTLGGIGARYRHWMAEIEGDVRSTESGVSGSDFGINALDDKETIHDAAIWLPSLPIIGQLHAQYWWGGWDGGEFNASNFNFSGRTFGPGDIDVEQEWKSFAFLWESPLGGVLAIFQSLGLTGQVGLKYVDMDMDIEGFDLTGGPLSADVGTRAWMPVLGAAGSWNPLGFLGINLELNGGYLTGLFDIKGLVFDFTATIRITISNFYLGAGYRWIKFDFTDDSPKGADELDVDVQIKGLIFEGGFRF